MKFVAILVFALLVLADLSASTQYAAGALRHAPGLGPPWLVVAGTPVRLFGLKG